MDYKETSSGTMEQKSRSIDRGWAWIVVPGALGINIIYDCCSYSFGIYFPKLLDYFGETKGKRPLGSDHHFSLSLFYAVQSLHVFREKLGTEKQP